MGGTKYKNDVGTQFDVERGKNVFFLARLRGGPIFETGLKTYKIRRKNSNSAPWPQHKNKAQQWLIFMHSLNSGGAHTDAAPICTNKLCTRIYSQ